MRRGNNRLPEFPPKDAERPVPINIRLPRELWERLDAVAKREGRSRNEVVTFFLRWACDDYEAAQARKKK